MRNPNRIPVILKEIQHYWEKMPDMRFLQIITIFMEWLYDKGYDTFNIEDSEFSNLFRFFLDEVFEDVV